MKRGASPMRKGVLALVLSGVALLGGYGVLIGAVCIWVGVQSTQREGFWVPVLAGVLTVCVVLLVVLPSIRALCHAFLGGSVRPELEGY